MTNLKFRIDTKTIKAIYPYETSFFVKDLGVLAKHEGKIYTEQEVKEIIADLIMNPPYIEGAMSLKLSVSFNGGYYHILDFKNLKYREQAKGNPTIKQ